MECVLSCLLSEELIGFDASQEIDAATTDATKVRLLLQVLQGGGGARTLIRLLDRLLF